MKRLSVVLMLALAASILFLSNAQAAMLIDDFNDGNADGWWFGPSHANPSNYGNWKESIMGC